MKLGMVISTQPTSFSAVGHSRDLDAALKSIASTGYDGVELAVRNPKDIDLPALRKLLKKHGLEVPAIGTGQAFLDEGLSLSSKKSAERKKAVDRLKNHITLAAELKAGVIVGLIRGRGEASKQEENQKLMRIFSESLSECADFAQRLGVRVFVEPINRYETALVNTIAEGMELIGGIGKDNVRLLVDTFHMNIEEASICGSIVRAARLIGHAHFADSNRRPPGSGHLEFADIVAVLSSVGYNGYVSMETLPHPSQEKAAEMSMNHLKNIMA